MTRLEFFEKGYGLIAAKLGVVPFSLLVKYDIYKTYREFLKAGQPEEEARRLTVKGCKYHYSTVARSIYWFERDESYRIHKEVRLQIVANDLTK